MSQAAFTLRVLVEADDLSGLVASPDVFAELVGVEGVPVLAVLCVDVEPLGDTCTDCFGSFDHPTDLGAPMCHRAEVTALVAR